jgi:hypothetical protein
VKAQLPRSEAGSPKKAKAAVRPSSVALKKPKANAVTAKPAKPSAKPARSNGARSSKVSAVASASSSKPAVIRSGATPKTAGAAPARKAPAPREVAASAAKVATPSSGKLVKPTPPSKLAAAGKAATVAKPTRIEPTPAAVVKKPARKSIKEAAGVSTDAVARRTGKTWDDWFEVLDSAGAASLDQRGIIAILAQKHGIGPWWQQMIAVGYESLRGKSDKPPAVDGFQINSTCLLDAPVNRVFRLWNDAGERARWLADDRFIVRGATADKVIRARWGKGNSHVAVSFNEKSGRTEVSVEHLQIESRGAAEQMKAYWAKKLGLLDEALAPRR